MSKFHGLSDDVAGVILVGAEGCSETEGETWLRDSTEEESALFKQYCEELVRQRGSKFDYGDYTVDLSGRPYWLKTVLLTGSTPVVAIEKAQKFTRTVRVHVPY